MTSPGEASERAEVTSSVLVARASHSGPELAGGGAATAVSGAGSEFEPEEARTTAAAASKATATAAKAYPIRRPEGRRIPNQRARRPLSCQPLRGRSAPGPEPS